MTTGWQGKTDQYNFRARQSLTGLSEITYGKFMAVLEPENNRFLAYPSIVRIPTHSSDHHSVFLLHNYS